MDVLDINGVNIFKEFFHAVNLNKRRKKISPPKISKFTGEIFFVKFSL